MQLGDKLTGYYLKFAVLFCWFFSLMVGLTTFESQNPVEIVLKGVVVGIGGWCGWGILRRRRQVILFTVGLCFYALFGSFVWLYYSLLIPYYYGQNMEIGLYEYLAFIYIFCAGTVIKLLLGKNAKQYFIK